MKKLLIAGIAAASFIAVSTYAGHTENKTLLSSNYDEEYQQDSLKKHSDSSKHKMKKWKDSTEKKWKDSTKKKP